MLKNKKILIGVCGSIAAYKIAVLVRLLIKSGADVRVIMTDAAKDFITPLTLATLSKNDVESDFYDAKTGVWANHVALALWADVFVIAPATANEIAKMANGICDNLLTATYLSAKCAVHVCPAMDVDMYKHGAVVANIQKLISYHSYIIDAENGELASGLYGEGRMAEPETIVQKLHTFFTPKVSILKNKKFILTAGPTQEAIDPVRYISNHSTGKMGIALANELANRGAEVILVVGVVSNALLMATKGVQIIKTTSAAQMYEACVPHFAATDVAIFSAAVADYRPAVVSENKIKKSDADLQIALTKNVDIALAFGNTKSTSQLSVGFALETQNVHQYAKEKLQNKNFDMIILNSMQDSGATFGYDTNKISILEKNSDFVTYPLKSKIEVAIDIVDALEKMVANKKLV